jgi:all-trans-retinol dehydrogenase (NAD+)
VVHPTWIRTPLIEGLTSNPKFKDPVLEPEDVALPIVNQVLRGRSGQLVFPENLKRVTGIRGWPSWLQNLARDKVASGLTVISGKD